MQFGALECLWIEALDDAASVQEEQPQLSAQYTSNDNTGASQSSNDSEIAPEITLKGFPTSRNTSSSPKHFTLAFPTRSESDSPGKLLSWSDILGDLHWSPCTKPLPSPNGSSTV